MRSKFAIAFLTIVTLCMAGVWVKPNVLAAGASATQPGAVFYVAVNGNDAWSGKLASPNGNDGPFATLERARNEIRKLKKSGGLPAGGVAVEIRAGSYELASTLKLDKQDSGEPDKPIVYRAFKGETPRILGGRVVAGWTPVTDSAVLARLDPSARGHVLQADLKSQKITDFGEVKPGPGWGQSTAGLEVFFQEKPMTLARWPNEGFVKIPKVLGPTVMAKSWDGKKTCKEGIFSYEGDRPRRWVGEPNIMLEGYWRWDWADQRLKVESIDLEKRIIKLQPKPEHAFGFGEKQWYYAYNLLCELDQPGEWYLDRTKGILYFWPPADVAQGRPTLSMLSSLIELKGAAHVAFRGFLFEMCRGTAVVADNVEDVKIAASVIRNTGSFAVSLSGRDSSIVGCDIYDNGDGGITLTGGDRKTLTPGNLTADDNHIHHYGRVNRMYKGAISLNGVGNHATHNLIDNAPHTAIFFSGNDHRIEFNEIHSVCFESNDAGAIYTGRNWTFRGNVIRCNYFHDISGYEGRGCVGVYLDDQMSCAEITENLFVRVTRASMIGGGRDTTIANNVYVDCKPSIHVDARGLTWPAGGGHPDMFKRMKESLDQVPYQGPVWANRYPTLAKILSDDPMSPLGNVVARNVIFGVEKWSDIDKPSKPLVKLQDNLIGEDPHFVDAAHGNYQLKDDSPAFKFGFKRIPLEKIGLYASEDRASWPVASSVRPAGKPPVKNPKKK